MKYSVLFLGALFAAANLASANEKNLSYDEQLKLSNVVVTASRMAEIDNVSASVTVFTRDDIERLRPVNVLELLTHAPGVQVATYGGKGALYGLYIRGTSTAQSLVLIDGARVGSATAGMAMLQYLSIDQIERVEVLRGPRSSIYGSEAIGGVVQVFTRRGTETGLSANVRVAGGSFGNWENSVGINGGNTKTRFNITAGYETTNGFDRTQESWPSDDDRDGYENKSWSFNASHRFNSNTEIGISTLQQQGKTETDNPYGRSYYTGVTWASAATKPYDNFSITSVSSFVNAQITDLWKSRLEIGYSEDKQEYLDELFSSYSKANSYRKTAQWFNTLEFNNQNSLLLGLDYLKDHINTSNNEAVTDRWNHAAIAQYQFTTNLIFAEFGSRYDYNEQFGEANTFNGLFGINITDTQTLRFLYAESFRAPTFNDLYYPFMGNANLKPETSNTYELKWVSTFLNTVIEASIYRTDINDMIAWDSIAEKPNNINSVRIDGFEFNMHNNVFGLDTNVGISLIDPTDRKTGNQLPNRAKATAFLDIDKQINAFGFGMSFSAVGKSYADAANTQKLDGYAIVDLRAHWQMSNTLEVDLKLANLFDKNYHRFAYSGEYTGLYEEAPFSAMLGVTWTPSLK